MGAPVILVVGAGSGVGASVARRFGREGYDVALLARNAASLEALAVELQGAGVTTGWTAVDVTDGPAVAEAVGRFGAHAGRLDVVHFNPSALRMAGPLDLGVEELLDDVRLGVGALLSVVRAARPFLSDGSRVLVTGSRAADRPWHRAASLGVQKAAVRNLVRSLDAALQPDGVRAMSLTVNGTLAPDTRFSPDLVADALFAAARRANEAWTAEVAYDG
jgi:NADP-dependent 3-hydroxy acid dehydrogenase YdfG